MPTTRLRAAKGIALAASILATVALISGCSSGTDDAGDTKEALIQRGVLTVGTEGTYSPFTFHDPDTKELTGYDVDVITAIADEIGVKVQFSETEWDSIFAGLKAGRFELVANQVTKTEERAGLYALSDPYTVAHGVIIARQDEASDITSLDDIKGKSSAQSTTSNWAQVATDAGATVVSVEGFAQAVTLVQQKRADVTVNDSLVAADYLKTTGATDVVVAAELPDSFTAESVFALRKGSGLLPVINDALAAIRADGTLTKISEKWFGKDVSQ